VIKMTTRITKYQIRKHEKEISETLVPIQILGLGKGPPSFLFSAPKFNWSGIGRALPDDYRLATLNEFTLRYRYDVNFRKEVRWGSFWIGQIGLKSSGFHLIEENGEFTEVTKEQYLDLPRKKRSLHIPGPAPVVVSFMTFGDPFVPQLAVHGNEGLREDMGTYIVPHDHEAALPIVQILRT
jgi:hypothetical protein